MMQALIVPNIKKPSVYVAGSWNNRKYIKEEWINKLNYEITVDWTTSENSHENKFSNQASAILDFEGVLNADFIIVIMNEQQSTEHAYRGTFFEMGVAYAMGIPIHVYCPLPLTDNNGNSIGIGRNIFLHLPNVIIYNTKESLLKNLPMSNL